MSLTFDERELRDALPPPVGERTRAINGGRASAARGPVLYWMRIAARDHENAALDAAIAAANALSTTLLVYHGIAESYPFASDRIHRFLLEGARDVAHGLRERGIPYALHVERPGARGPYLRDLAREAALVVTEDAPFPPLADWTTRLSADLSIRRIPFWAVDASCVVPMRLLTQRYDRAFTFRAATRALVAERLATRWSELELLSKGPLPALPFVSVPIADTDDAGLARLIATCRIDHAVGPVPELRGGMLAGYARWSHFLSAGLARYAEQRNDAAVDGTSRMSSYLHVGHVSALRIAQQAARVAGLGAEKFLDELLVWRELAWNLAAHTPDLESLDVLPGWARASLASHAGDARVVMTAERLERGRTGDELWDLAQRSLRVHGELHNNVRMTWGKAVPAWTESPEAARRMLVALNHRYALDGRDPASYAGLYWCLGLFDRPFAPEAPILGTVRSRPTADHARRVGVDRYRERVTRPTRSQRRVAVIGAGVAGLACARTLLDHDVEVVTFDKGRRPGGRLATRREGSLEVDLGAQYFTARDPRFVRWVDSWRAEGVCALWQARVMGCERPGSPLTATATASRLVGTPSMSAIPRHLARDVPIRSSHRVERLERRRGQWVLHGTVAADRTLAPVSEHAGEPALELGTFDLVIVCLPSPQAADLVTPVADKLGRVLAGNNFEPCLALAVALRGVSKEAPFDALFVGRPGDEQRRLSWVAHDASKPQRAHGEAWVLHAAPEWSRENFRAPRERIERELIAELALVLDRGTLLPGETALKRWLLARPTEPLGVDSLFDDEMGLGLGGDWASSGRIEGAFLSGLSLAGRVLGWLNVAQA